MRSSLSQYSLAKNGLWNNFLCCRCKDKKRMVTQGTRRGPLSSPSKEPDPPNSGRSLAQGKRNPWPNGTRLSTHTNTQRSRQTREGQERVPSYQYHHPTTMAHPSPPRDRPRPPYDHSQFFETVDILSKPIPVSNLIGELGASQEFIRMVFLAMQSIIRIKYDISASVSVISGSPSTHSVAEAIIAILGLEQVWKGSKFPVTEHIGEWGVWSGLIDSSTSNLVDMAGREIHFTNGVNPF